MHKGTTGPKALARDAREFWIARGGLRDVGAVSPGGGSGRYRVWVRRCLLDWTLDRAHRHLGPRCRRAVDLGCGLGDWTVGLASMADEIIACDVSPGFVAETRSRLREAGHPAATVSCSDVRTFDGYRDADLVYLGALLMYLDDPDCLAVLRSIRARLAPGGVLLSRDWCALRWGRPAVNTSPWFSVHRRPRRYAELAAESGFRVAEQTSSPPIYGEAVAMRLFPRARSDAARAWLRPLAGAPWYAASLFWTRGSVSFVMLPA